MLESKALCALSCERIDEGAVANVAVLTVLIAEEDSDFNCFPYKSNSLPLISTCSSASRGAAKSTACSTIECILSSGIGAILEFKIDLEIVANEFVGFFGFEQVFVTFEVLVGVGESGSSDKSISSRSSSISPKSDEKKGSK